MKVFEGRMQIIQAIFFRNLLFYYSKDVFFCFGVSFVYNSYTYLAEVVIKETIE